MAEEITLAGLDIRLTILETESNNIKTEAAKAAAAEMQQQLNRLTTSKAAINSVTWQVFSIFTAGMAVLANGVAQTLAPNHAIALSLFGLFTAIIWLPLQNRMLGYLSMHETVIDRLEPKMVPDAKHSVSQTWNKDDFDAAMNRGAPFRARNLMRAWIGFVCVGWLVSLFVQRGTILTLAQAIWQRLF